MKNSTKVWSLIGAAAMFAPLALSAPALADGGRTGPESKSPAFRAEVSAMAVDTKIKATSTLERLLAWNDAMLDANALDHTATSGFAGDQQGPTRNSRAFAIIQIAVYDAVNSFNKKFEPFSPGISQAPSGASKDAAIAYSAYTALKAMYPRQEARFDALLASDLAQIKGNAKSIADGRAVGEAAANAILSARTNDGAGPAGTSTVVAFGAGGAIADGTTNIFDEPINGGQTAAPRWAPDRGPADDGVTGIRNAALGASWGAVTPFVLTSGDQFRIPAYPAPGSPRFRAAYNDVFINGGEDIEDVVGTDNTAAKQFIGNFWGYDGAPLLGTPPRLYNQVAIVVANARGLQDVEEYARLLALVNVTMGDAGIAAWDSKYYHNYWRPGNGIRDADADGDPMTVPLDSWRPFGASVINGEVAERFTPPFPAYPSGHATFGAAMAQSLTSLFGNNVRFTFVSDEYDGEGLDPRNGGLSVNGVRPLVPVRYRSLLGAQQENGRSRVFNGVHWEPDDTEGQNLGTAIVQYTLTQKFRRR